MNVIGEDRVLIAVGSERKTERELDAKDCELMMRGKKRRGCSRVAEANIMVLRHALLVLIVVAQRDPHRSTTARYPLLTPSSSSSVALQP